MLAQGLGAPFCVEALEQTQGRGRGGRKWETSLGHYSASFVVPMPANKADAPKISLVAALALSSTFKELGLPDIAIKWPNDVLVARRKIAGILLEGEGDFLILGIGVNLARPVSPEYLEKRAIAPAALSEFCAVGFEAFHERLATNLARGLDEFERSGFDPVRNALKGQLLLRETMIFDDGRSERLITARDIGENGQLVVDFGGETKEVYAGDLWFEEGA